jgi:lipoprotein Spr
VKFIKIIAILFVVISLFACHTKKATKGISKRDVSEKKEYYSNKFGISLDRESNLKLYAAVDSWMGVKYKYASCTKSGIDCSCLVNALYKEAYLCNTPRDTKGLYEAINKIDKDNLREGDLVFFNMKAGKIDHVGVYLSNHKFVHASTKLGVMVSSLDEEHFRKSFKTAGRLKCS